MRCNYFIQLPAETPTNQRRIKTTSIVKVYEQDILRNFVEKSVPLYSLNNNQKEILDVINIKLTADVKEPIAFFTDEDIKPMFKKGSIFILDTNLTPENDTLVAVKIEGYKKILIRKFYIEGHKKILKSYENGSPLIELMPTMHYTILGVVIQVNTKT